MIFHIAYDGLMTIKRNYNLEVVVVTRNSVRHIGACVESIVAAGALPIIVDNGSTDDTLEIVRSLCRQARIIATGENLGYGRAMNLGFKETSSEFVILSNPDVVFLGDSIHRMVEFLRKNPEIGITGPQQMFPDRSWQRSYGELPGIWPGIKDALGITTLQSGIRRFLWPRRVDKKPKKVPYVDGGILLVRRQAFESVGGFDEQFFFYGDESDLCARLWNAKWSVVFCPWAQVVHARGADSIQVDSSDRFVRHMVNSQSKLARKYLAPDRARLYMRLQTVHFERLALTYSILKPFLGGASASRAKEKIRVFRTYSKVLREYLQTGSVALPN